jgi:hypothetical protein
MAEPLYNEREKLVEDEGVYVLAFIDICNEQGFSWSIQSHRGFVRFAAHRPETGEIDSGPCPDFATAKTRFAERCIAAGMKGAASG